MVAELGGGMVRSQAPVLGPLDLRRQVGQRAKAEAPGRARAIGSSTGAFEGSSSPGFSPWVSSGAAPANAA